MGCPSTRWQAGGQRCFTIYRPATGLQSPGMAYWARVLPWMVDPVGGAARSEALCANAGCHTVSLQQLTFAMHCYVIEGKGSRYWHCNRLG